MSFDWKEAIRTIAPTIVGLTATPAAGMAVKVLADVLLGGTTGDAVTDEAKIAGMLAGGITPELRAKLIDAELEVKKQAHEIRKLLISQETELYSTDAKDRDSARRAAIDGGNAQRTFWFAFWIFTTVVGIEGYLLVAGMPHDIKYPELFGRLLGTLDAAMLAALYYIFGSSQGSARKNLDLRVAA